MAKLNQFFKTIQQEQSHENTETTEDVTHSEQGQPVQVTDVMPVLLCPNWPDHSGLHHGECFKMFDTKFNFIK